MSRSGFYSWQFRGLSARERRDEELLPMVREIFGRHRRRYGARRIAIELADRGEVCGVARVAKLLEIQGLRAIQPKSYRPRTTNSRHRLGYNSNLLRDRSAPEQIDQVWVADITYIPLRRGCFGYLSVLMDLHSRRIVGWEYQESMTEVGMAKAFQVCEAVDAGGRSTGNGIHAHDRLCRRSQEPSNRDAQTSGVKTQCIPQTSFPAVTICAPGGERRPASCCSTEIFKDLLRATTSICRITRIYPGIAWTTGHINFAGPGQQRQVGWKRPRVGAHLTFGSLGRISRARCKWRRASALRPCRT